MIMGVLMKEALKYLCRGDGAAGWCYGIFWKINPRNPMLLIWEDGHYEPLRYSEFSGESAIQNRELFLKEWEAVWNPAENCSFQIKAQTEDRICTIFKQMVHQVHVGGQGVVGCVASTGKHQWVFRETYTGDGCQLQFSAGIQTIAVIPVLPDGVVQLGSTQSIMENLEFVNHLQMIMMQLKNVPVAFKPENTQKALGQKFQMHGSLGMSASANPLRNPHARVGATLPLGRNSLERQTLHQDLASRLQSRPSSTVNTQMYENTQINASAVSLASSAVSTTTAKAYGGNFQQKDFPLKNHNGPPRTQLENSAKDHNIAPLLGGNCNLTASDIWRSIESYPSIEGVGPQYTNLPNVSVLPASNRLNNSNNVPVISGESRRSLSSVMTKQAGSEQTTRQGHNANDLFQAPDFQLAGSGGDKCFSWSRGIPGFIQDSLESCLNPPKGSQGSAISSCEGDGMAKVRDNPLDALDADFEVSPIHFNWDNLRGSSCISELDLVPGFDDTKSGFFSEAKSDHLLDAVVSKFCSSANQNSDDNLSCKTTLTMKDSISVDTGSNLYRPVAAPEQKQGDLFVLSQALAHAEITASGSFKSMDKTKEGFQTDGASKSQTSLWVEDGQGIKLDCSLNSHSKKSDEPGKPNRKRPRPGESSRPRPKDRQMIQDRVKELREIVPNGAKCSIDALLERTIKHMVFLQSVTKHADQLKQTSESKLISKDGCLLLKDNFEGGATWAFEVDSQSTVCPIIVEDLTHPRQKLVEMICEERGLFLEIADVIRGLGLTILKGVMEARSDKVWARFAVEAKREVTRMEIFLSLMRLLEQTAKPGLIPNGIRDSRNPALQNTCHQAIPVTGLVKSLQ